MDVGRGAVVERLGKAPDRGERGAQVMGHRHEELALSTLRPGQTGGHLVDRGRQGNQLMAYAGGDWDPRLEVAGGDLSGDRLGLEQRAGQAVAEAIGHNESAGQGGGGGDGEPNSGVPDAVGRLPCEHHHQGGHIGHLHRRGERIGGEGQAPPAPGDRQAVYKVGYVQLAHASGRWAEALPGSTGCRGPGSTTTPGWLRLGGPAGPGGRSETGATRRWTRGASRWQPPSGRPEPGSWRQKPVGSGSGGRC